MMLEGKMPMDMNAISVQQERMTGNGEQIKYIEVTKNIEGNGNGYN